MQEEDAEKGALRLNAGVVFQTMGSAPNGFVFKRDNADVMNNFFVNIVARSFTEIEEIYRQLRDNKEVQKQQEVLAEIEVVKSAWKNIISQECTENYDRFDKNISESKKTLEAKRNAITVGGETMGQFSRKGSNINDLEELLDM